MARGSNHLDGVTLNGRPVGNDYGSGPGVPPNNRRTYRASAPVGPRCNCGPGDCIHRHGWRATQW